MDDEVKCDKCGSSQVLINKRGVEVLLAMIFGILLFPWGLLAGLARSNDLILTCLKCGEKRKVSK